MAAFSTALLGRFNRILFAALVALCLVAVLPAGAAPYAALVMDARSGKVLYARNANTKLHPASLT
ncbi:MAG: D-alanyl-D-alanine carboxypeptidase, partial [Paracoccaceae bacterium]